MGQSYRGGFSLRPLYVVAAIAAFALSGCSDRPNDLNTYRDDPPRTQIAKTAPPTDGSAAGRSAPTTSAEPAPPDARVALLRDEEVADEGVRRLSEDTAPGSGCLDQAQRGAVDQAVARWEYPTGSQLRHQVAVLPEQAAAVLRAAHCAGRPVDVAVPGTVDVHRAWCEPSPRPASCTVVLTQGRIASAVQVWAQDVNRAREAVVRLAPAAAEALTRA